MDTFIELCSEESTVSPEKRLQQVQSLLENGELDPAKRYGNKGWYPVHYAAKFGHNDIVQLLLSDNHCNPHVQTRGGRYTPLHIASEHDRLEVVDTLLRYLPNGAPAKRDKEGNTPLHVACKNGSLEIVNRLTTKYSVNTIREINKAGSTPLGIAVNEGRPEIARFFLSLGQAVGNPHKLFSDFREMFPSFDHKQSLDHPVSIFVMGNRQTGKSTLIKSIQIEGYINRTIGVFKPTSGVEHHSGGIVPSDVSSYGYGRATFYELASCQQSTQENIFLSLEKRSYPMFIITLSFQQEMKEMATTLFYWLSFIYNQYRSVMPGIKPIVAVVGSFLFYNRLGSVRLDNRHRLHLVYHRVLNAHSELCSQFHFIGKFSMDCRLSESPGMRQLRGVLRRKCRGLRPGGGEATVPSSCYVLLSAIHEMRPADSHLPVLRLSEVEQNIAETSLSSHTSLLSLLPSHAEDLQPLLDTLQERKAIIVLSHLDHRNPWVIFDEYRLISLIDDALIQRALRMSVSSLFNPAIMDVDKLLGCFSSLSPALPKEVLINILHHFKITEVMAHGNDTKYFLPSVLNVASSSDTPLQSWNLSQHNYSLGFAQCILPQSKQMVPFFMPRFLYFLLYELFASTESDDFDLAIMSHSALYLQLESQLQIYIATDSSSIILSMRCSESGVFSCLQIRNRFESIINEQRKLFQPNLKVTEYVVPIEGLSFPIIKAKHINTHGIQVNDLKNILITRSTPSTTESMSKLRSFEPYEWLAKLQKNHLDSLLDSRLTNVEVGKSFIHNLARCVGGDNWKKLLEYSEILQECDTTSSPEEQDTDDSAGSPHTKLSQQQPTYGRLLELFSSMSIFQSISELISALKDPKEYENISTSNETPSDNDAIPGPQPPAQSEIQFNPKEGSLSFLPQSSSSSSVSVGLNKYSAPDLSQSGLPDAVTLMTCSTSSDASSIASIGMRCNVPNVPVGTAIVPVSDLPQNVHFVTTPEMLKCGATGGRYEDKMHHISFTIPPQAVPEGNEISIEFAIAVIGPFTFPDDITPVSPILWVRLKSHKTLQKPVELVIPHAVHCRENSKLLYVLCAQNTRENYGLMRTHKKSKIHSNTGMLHTKLSKQQYFFCIAAKTCQEVVANTQYSIIKVMPTHPFGNTWKLYFFITYALPACVEMVRQQFGVEYAVTGDSVFQFDTSMGEDPCITVEYERVTQEQWTLTKDGTYRKIEASKVLLGNVSSFQMNMMNRYHVYPPNFTITVSGHQATGHGYVAFVFRGAVQTDLLYEIALTLPRKDTMNSLTSTVDEELPETDDNQKSEEETTHNELPRGHVRSSSGSWSVRSAPVVPSYEVRYPDSGSTTPRNRDQEKKNAMSVLIDNYINICNHLDNSAIRRHLVQLRALTFEESNTLLNSANTSEANERLLNMIQKGGVEGFKQFVIALERTSDEYPGHREILSDLKADLKHVMPHSRSATNILSSFFLPNTQHRLSVSSAGN